MHVLLASIGTDGDIFPYVGLGVALRSRGHSVSLAASAHYEGLAKGHGFAFHPLLSTEENDELFGNPDFWNPLKTAPLSARWGVKFLRRQYDLLSNLITPDTVLVANPKLMRSPCRQSLSKSLPPGTSLKLFLDPPPAGGCKRYVI